MLECHIC